VRLKIAAIAFAAVAAVVVVFTLVERAVGPSAEPLPATLPHIVRRPPPIAVHWTSAATPINPTEEARRLHARGITGRNVGIAIIDSFLLTDHREYRDRLRWYDELDARPADPAGWHATAVASIAVGQTVGVAPEADLYFVGLGLIWARQPLGNWFAALVRGAHAGQHQALAIRRILEINRRLDPDRKIRAISMSIGPGARWLNQTADAVEEARREGIFVSALDLGAAPFGPVRIASAASPDEYLVYGPAGSWAIAYWAGRYALAWQEDHAMTPARFRATVFTPTPKR